MRVVLYTDNDATDKTMYKQLKIADRQLKMAKATNRECKMKDECKAMPTEGGVRARQRLCEVGRRKTN